MNGEATITGKRLDHQMNQKAMMKTTLRFWKDSESQVACEVKVQFEETSYE